MGAIRLGLLAMVSSPFLALSTAAHEVRPAVADIAVGLEAVEIKLIFSSEPIVAGVDLQGLFDTNDSPLASEVDRLRALPPAEMKAALRAEWGRLREGIRLETGETRFFPDIASVEVEEVGNIDLPRDTVMLLRAELPDGDGPVTFAWKPSYGPIVLREMREGDDAYTGFLAGGAPSSPLERQSDGFLGGLFGG